MVITACYGDAAILSSGLVVDALHAFENLWVACTTANGWGEDITSESSENAVKRDWVRRFKNFADNYLDGDTAKADACLKDAYLLHKWNKIQAHFTEIEWTKEIKTVKAVDMDTLGAAACSGGACEIDF